MPDVAGYRDRAALERDASPRGRVTLDYDQAAPGRGPNALRRVALHHDRSRPEVLADGPADEAGDRDGGAVAEAADEIPGVARDGDVQPAGDTHHQVVAATRLADVDGRSVRKAAQNGVYLPHGHVSAAEFGRRQACHV